MRRSVGLLFVVLALGVLAAVLSRCDGRPAPAIDRGVVTPEARAPTAAEDERKRERVRVTADDQQEPDQDLAFAEDAWVVRVVDGDGRPIRGAAVSSHDSVVLAERLFTDSAGEVTFDREWDLVSTPLIQGQIKVTSQLTILTVGDLRPVEVRIVDFETGAPLEVEWDGGEGPATRSDRTSAWARPGGRVEAEIRFAPPAGWIYPVITSERSLGKACIHAERYVAVVPVPRETRLRVTVMYEDGAMAPGASARAYIPDRPLWPWPHAMALYGRGDADAQGVVTLRGLPLVRGEQVKIKAEAPPPPNAPEGEEDIWAEGEAEPLLLIGADHMHEASVVVSTISDSNESQFEEPGGNSTIGIGGSGEPIENAAFLTVRASTRAGRPARGAAIRLRGASWDWEIADDDGTATFDELPPGDYSVWLDQSGLVATSTTVTLAPKERATITLREAPGRDVRVRVVDPRGKPLPHALVEVDVEDGWLSYAHIVGGVQTLVPMSGPDGRITLVGLPSNEVRVRAWYGSRWAEWTAAEGAETKLTVPDAE